MRISILEVLGIDGGRVLSPRDLSHELYAPLSRVNYHVTELASSGLIELVGERAVRGATEHFYKLVDHSPNGASSNGASSEAGGGIDPRRRRKPAARKA